LIAISQADLPVRPIQADGSHAEPPLRFYRSHAWKLRVIGWNPARQYLLREGWTIVRFVRLVTDDGQVTAETLLAQRLCSAESSQGSADNDYPAGALK
jgi:hypothetical protein